MSRSTFVFRPGHPRANERGFVEVGELGDIEPENLNSGHIAIVGDTHHDGVRAPDGRGPDGLGTDISTKKRRREYMKANGLADFDDYNGTWQRAERERAELSTTGGDHKSRTEQIERAIHDLEGGRVKPNRAKVSEKERQRFSEIARDVASKMRG